MYLNYTNVVTINNKILIVFSMLFIGLGSISVYSQSCNSDLSVKKDRNSRSISEDGAVFSMVLKNNSSSTATYSFAFKNLSGRCGNRSSGASVQNVSLDVAFLPNNSNSEMRNGISLSPGKSLEFKVRVTAPYGTPYGSWGCIQVDAIPNNCTATSTILKVYVPDPSKG